MIILILIVFRFLIERYYTFLLKAFSPKFKIWTFSKERLFKFERKTNAW